MTLFYVPLLLTRILFITKGPWNFKFFKRYNVLGNPVEIRTLLVGNVIGEVGQVILSLRVVDAASS
jgi:hypothetical protein